MRRRLPSVEGILSKGAEARRLQHFLGQFVLGRTLSLFCVRDEY